jgi:hypothetical protein
MKIFFSLLLTLGMATPALAQGKVNFQNNSLHLVYWDPWLGTAYAGHAYTVGDGGFVFTIDLWAGTSSTSLSLQATTDFSGQSSPGTWPSRTVLMPSVGAGMDFFDIRIHDAANFAWGDSGIFTAQASGGTAYYSLVQHNTPGNSTWADGTYNLDSVSPGFRGAIMLTPGPEPSSFALACLGCALLLLRRRADSLKIQK